MGGDTEPGSGGVPEAAQGRPVPGADAGAAAGVSAVVRDRLGGGVGFVDRDDPGHRGDCAAGHGLVVDAHRRRDRGAAVAAGRGREGRGLGVARLQDVAAAVLLQLPLRGALLRGGAGEGHGRRARPRAARDHDRPGHGIGRGREHARRRRTGRRTRTRRRRARRV